jgi:hypothetical protein
VRAPIAKSCKSGTLLLALAFPRSFALGCAFALLAGEAASDRRYILVSPMGVKKRLTLE